MNINNLKALIVSVVLYSCIFPSYLYSSEFIPIVQKTHNGNQIKKIIFSPDGQYIISSATDNTIKVWREKDGFLVRSITSNSTNLIDFEISADQKYLASSFSGDEFMLSDFNSGSELQTISRNNHDANIEFSSDGSFIASSEKDSINIYSIGSKYSVGKSININSEITCLAITADDKFIISGSRDAFIRIWNIQDKKVVFEKSLPEDNFPLSFTVTQDNRYLIVRYANDDNLHVWEIITKGDGVNLKYFKKIKNKKGFHMYMCLSRDGKVLATTTMKAEEIVIISTSDWKVQKVIEVPDIISCISLSPDGEHIAVGYFENHIDLYNLNTGLLKKRIGSRELESRLIVPTYDGKYIFSVYKNVISMWRLSDLSVYKTFVQPYPIHRIALTRDDKYLIYSPVHSNDYNYRQVNVILTENGEEVAKIKDVKDYVRDLLVTPKNDYLVIGTYDGEIETVSTKNWKTVSHLLEKLSGPVSELEVTTANELIVSFNGDNTERINIFGIPSLNLLKEVYCPNTWFLSVNPAKDYYAAPKLDFNSIGLYKVSEKYPYQELKGHESQINTVAFSQDGRYMASGEANGTINLWETAGNTVLKKMTGHNGSISHLFFLSGGKYLISSSWADGLAKIWNIQSGENVSIVSNDKDWIVFDNKGYFDSSAKGGELIAMCKGLEAYAIDQFAVKNNRPDLLLDRIEIDSVQTKAYFYNKHLKRLKKLNISGVDSLNSFNVPELSIIGTRQEDTILNVNFIIMEKQYELYSYNVYVNDVPVYGSYGKKVSGKKQEIYEQVELSNGKNKIEISCVNDRGAESYRSVFYAENDQKSIGDLYFIGFGVSNYKNSTLNLQYADQDVLDLADLFQKTGDAYNNVYVNTYINEDVTKENIISAKDLLLNAGVNDTFVLFIAGHGVHDADNSATYYYITHDTDINNLKETAAEFELVEDLLRGIKPRNKLFLMDTCESGEIDEEVSTEYFDYAGSRGIRARTTRALTIALKKNLTRKKREFLLERDRYIFNDLSRRSGAIVFSSSKGGEFSFESDDYKNGFFTEEIINGFKGKADADLNGKITSDELRDYVSKAVPLLSGEKQHPTVDRDNIYQSLSFPVVR